MRVVVIGAGASGTLTAAHLVRSSTRARLPLRVEVVEPDCVGRGVAYSTTDERHRLNVATASMTAWADEPDHFLRWLRAKHDSSYPAEGFAPRTVYGSYLADTLRLN